MPGTEPSPEQFALLVHLLQHMRSEKGRSQPAVLLLADCWFAAEEAAPDWAVEAAEGNAPGWQWCPWANPRLLRSSSPA